MLVRRPMSAANNDAASRRDELERAVRGLEATRDIAIAIGTDTSLERVLKLIADHGGNAEVVVLRSRRATRDYLIAETAQASGSARPVSAGDQRG